jgi:hypothetical protein
VHVLHFIGSSCSQKLRVFLSLKKIPWQSHPIDLPGNENMQPWFLGINPRGLVPVLVHDGAVHIEGNFPESIVLDIFTGPNLRRLNRVRASHPRTWIYDFKAVAGRTYWIAAYNQRLTPGSFGDTFDFDLTMRILSVHRANAPDNSPVTHVEDVPMTIDTPVSPADILSVEYLVDGAVMGSNTVAPFNFTLPPLRGGEFA